MWMRRTAFLIVGMALALADVSAGLAQPQRQPPIIPALVPYASTRIPRGCPTGGPCTWSAWARAAPWSS